MLPAFVALSLFVFSVYFSFCHYSFGRGFRGFRLSCNGYCITALDFVSQAGGFRIDLFTGVRVFRGFRGFRFLGVPISRTCLRLAVEIPPLLISELRTEMFRYSRAPYIPTV